MLKLGLVVGFVIVLLDQLTKLLIRNLILHSDQSVEVTSFLNIVEVWNRGVSFGLFSNNSVVTPYILSALAIAIAIVLIVWLQKTKTYRLAIALGSVIGGAIGNVTDRLHWGRVFDFLDFHIAEYHWPAFNLADSAITIGAAFILLDGFIAKRPERE